MIGIYKITSPNNRVYIGQSIDIERRFKFYKQINCKKQPILYKSLIKYGVDNHTFEIIEECLFENLNTQERYWQEFYNVLNGGLNCHLTSTEILPKIHSQETKDKISKSSLGKTFSQDTKNKMSKSKLHSSNGLDNNFYGKEHTIEFKQERSTKRMGGGNPNAKLVLNIETGVYYDNALEVANMLGLKKETFRGWLSGRYPNKTSFIYV